MPTCVCQTQNGTRCTRPIQTGSIYCKQHQTCKKETNDDDEISNSTSMTLQLLHAHSEDVKNLVKERNFYYKKLEKIEEFANTLNGINKKTLLKLLSQKSNK